MPIIFAEKLSFGINSDPSIVKFYYASVKADDKSRETDEKVIEPQKVDMWWMIGIMSWNCQ